MNLDFSLEAMNRLDNILSDKQPSKEVNNSSFVPKTTFEDLLNNI
jgi:hypothetical protein